MIKKSIYKFLIPISFILSASSLNASDYLLDLPLKDLEKSAHKAFKSIKDKKVTIGKAELIKLKSLQKQFKKNPDDTNNTYELGKFNKLHFATPIHSDLGLRYMILSGGKGQFEAARFIEFSNDKLTIAQKNAVQKLYALAMKDHEYRDIAAWALAVSNKNELDKKLWDNIAELDLTDLNLNQKNKKVGRLKKDYAVTLSNVLSQSFYLFLELSNPLENATTSNFLVAHTPHSGFDEVTYQNNLIMPRLNMYENTYHVKTHDYQNYTRIMQHGAELDLFAKKLFVFMQNHSSKKVFLKRTELNREFLSLSNRQEKTLVAIEEINQNIKKSFDNNRDSRHLRALEDELLHLQKVKKASIKAFTYLENLFKRVKKYY